VPNCCCGGAGEASGLASCSGAAALGAPDPKVGPGPGLGPELGPGAGGAAAAGTPRSSASSAAGSGGGLGGGRGGPSGGGSRCGCGPAPAAAGYWPLPVSAWPCASAARLVVSARARHARQASASARSTARAAGCNRRIAEQPVGSAAGAVTQLRLGAAVARWGAPPQRTALFVAGVLAGREPHRTAEQLRLHRAAFSSLRAS